MKRNYTKAILTGLLGGAIYTLLDLGFDYKMKVEFDLTRTAILFLAMSLVNFGIALITQKQANESN